MRKLKTKWLRYSVSLLIIAAVSVVIFILRQFDLSTPQAPLGDGIELIMDWTIINLSPALETIKIGLTRVFIAVEAFFLLFPWPVWLVFIGVLGWRIASWGVGLSMTVGLLIIQFTGLWAEAMSTIALVSTAVFFTVIIAVPIGIIASRSDHFERILRPILDAMQTIPALVYLIPAIMLLGVGKVPAIAATMIFGVPPTIRLTNLGLRQVPAEVKEAAQAFGASGWQLLTVVEIPMALRTIMAGINQSTMMSVSMVVIAAFIGAGGLGYSVLFALGRVRIGPGFEAGLAILVIAIILDRLTQALGKIGQPLEKQFK